MRCYHKNIVKHHSRIRLPILFNVLKQNHSYLPYSHKSQELKEQTNNKKVRDQKENKS